MLTQRAPLLLEELGRFALLRLLAVLSFLLLPLSPAHAKTSTVRVDELDDLYALSVLRNFSRRYRFAK
jgi:hypothetical protein